MHYGFVLDQDACIGCHACTVGCKAENDVPLGNFRTWVKWVEHGEFPETKRSAAVLRCNHCKDAPCISICPTGALHKRPDGIVDLDEARCIGCASCLQACPYDAIYIDDEEGTAAKCHFCAHRIEVGLAPACVSVCPEQAIKVVDFDDPDTLVALEDRLAVARKPERGTRPQTMYIGADPAALDPLAVDGTRTMSHSSVPDPMPAPGNAEARAVYDVPRKRQWGSKIAAYMVTKAGAAGALLLAAATPFAAGTPLANLDARILAALSLALLAITGVLLIADLHKPQRFYFLLTMGNRGSWLVKGAWVLMAHGVLAGLWLLGLSHPVLSLLTVPSALMTAVYTAFLFRQARGRELWCEDRLLPWLLAVQAVAAAAAIAWAFGVDSPWLLVLLALYPATVALEFFTPGTTRAARRGHEVMVRHPSYAAGAALAMASIFLAPLVFVAFLCLDWAYVHAGQEVPLS